MVGVAAGRIPQAGRALPGLQPMSGDIGLRVGFRVGWGLGSEDGEGLLGVGRFDVPKDGEGLLEALAGLPLAPQLLVLTAKIVEMDAR